MFWKHHHHRRRWSEGESPFGDWPFGRWGGGRRWGGFGQGERFFGRGDLKVVILELLKDQPRHGYDIIRALEEKAGGFYRPSPGSVYPTLQMLEDLGYVSSTQQEGKKIYAITDAGRKYLAEQQPTLEDIRSRIASGFDAAARPELADLMHEMRGVGQALFRHATKGVLQDPERLKQLRAILERTRREIDAVGETTVV